MPAVSFIIPAYNAEKYLSDALDSIRQQTFNDWELIVVNDASTDSTAEIINRYTDLDFRIRSIHRKENSGSCRLPRFDGVLSAQGDYICSIDSDDWIEGEYVEKMICRARETGADIVCGKMVMSSSSGHLLGRAIPSTDEDLYATLSPLDACKRTIGEWKIALAGMFVKREIYQKYVREFYNVGKSLFYSIELDQRRLLLSSALIVMQKADYFYRQHDESIVHQVTLKSYDILTSKRDFVEWVNNVFGNGKELQIVIHEYLEDLYRAHCRYVENFFTYTERERYLIRKSLKKSYSFVKLYNLINTSLKEKLMLNNSMSLFFCAILQVLYVRIKKIYA